jgi:hypothetical protein
MRRSAVHPITCVQKFAQILSCRGTMKKQHHRVGKTILPVREAEQAQYEITRYGVCTFAPNEELFFFPF